MDHQRNIITPDARKFVFTRRLPKTGQTASYQAGDDGEYEAGWSIGQRFLPKRLSDNNVIIDRATGLMWPKGYGGAGGNYGVAVNWSNAIIYCEALNFAGFTDWRLPNVLEFFTLYNFGISGAPAIPRDWPLFTLTPGPFWSSTSMGPGTFAWVVYLGNTNAVYALAKTTLVKILAVREIY